ncbi:uncharacterized protein IWZ02DRAFT_90312 [Phyllosticta citriasiana]|uniref:Uncharacterized protein n=1 Tax=Phyllosticta citriasiana TaxID=595635 RepID=A0ABR1L4T9_9PEZI
MDIYSTFCRSGRIPPLPALGLLLPSVYLLDQVDALQEVWLVFKVLPIQPYFNSSLTTVGLLSILQKSLRIRDQISFSFSLICPFLCNNPSKRHGIDIPSSYSRPAGHGLQSSILNSHPEACSEPQLHQLAHCFPNSSAFQSPHHIRTFPPSARTRQAPNILDSLTPNNDQRRPTQALILPYMYMELRLPRTPCHVPLPMSEHDIRGWPTTAGMVAFRVHAARETTEQMGGDLGHGQGRAARPAAGDASPFPAAHRNGGFAGSLV